MQCAAVQELIESESQASEATLEPHLNYLAVQILHNLKYQHRWTNLQIHRNSPLTGKHLPRPVVSGLPPHRLYIHPDEQIELLQAEAERTNAANRERNQQAPSHGRPEDQAEASPSKSHESGAFAQPELEWVLPAHLRETWSLKKFAEVFDSVSIVPPAEEEDEQFPNWSAGIPPNKWRTKKRVLLATLSDDSTVSYYIVHDGLVKPRQN